MAPNDDMNTLAHDPDSDTGFASTGEQGSGTQRLAVVLYLAAVAAALMYCLVRLWPEAGADGAWSKQVIVFWRSAPVPNVSDDVRLLLLVIVAGGLGSFIHAATSFVDYVGNRKFVASWMLWYFMRPVIGSALALVLYMAVRGGLLTATAGAQSVSPFGVTALAFLSGMFSKQATDKLNELFTTLFKTSDGDGARKDKLDAGPKIVSVDPARLAAQGAILDVTVNGSGFESTTIVRVNGQPRETTFVTASQLRVKVKTSDIADAATLSLTAHNAAGGSSAPATVTVA